MTLGKSFGASGSYLQHEGRGTSIPFWVSLDEEPEFKNTR